jgi:chloride channel protein, CIC family
MVLKLMLLLLALKLIGVTISYASGNAGGIFGPSLFIGAMLGGSLGTMAHHLFSGSWLLPVLTPWSVWVLLPESCERSMISVVMIFEMTRDYAVVVPLMISNLVSFLFRHVCNANLSTKC